MNESTTTQLALTIDLKQFYASLQKMPGVSQEAITKINQLFSTVKPPKVTPEQADLNAATKNLEQLKSAYYMVTVGEENAASAAMNFVKSQNLTSSQIDLLVSSMLKEQSTLSLTSAEYAQAQTSINHLVAAKQRLVTAAMPAVRGMNQMGQSTTNLNYILRDSPFFFQRFDMGIMAVSNNLNPLIDDMLRAKATTGSWKGAIGQLTTGLMGIGGISVAFSAVVAAIQAYSFWAANSERETNKLRGEVDATKSSIEKLKEEMENFSTFTLRLNRDVNQAEIDAIVTAANLKAQEILNAGGRQLTLSESIGLVPGGFKYNQLMEENKLYDEQISQLGYKESLQFRINELLEEQNKLKEKDAVRSREITTEVKRLNAEIERFQGKVNGGLDGSSGSNGSNGTTALNFKYRLLTLTNEQLRAERELNIARLEDPNFIGSRVQILENILSINKQIAENAKEYMRLFDLQKTSGIPTTFNMSFVKALPKPQVFKETNAELERMLFLSDMMTDSFNQAGDAVAGAMGNSARFFKTANSLAQIFINSLIEAAVRALVLKGIMFIFGLFSGGSATAVIASPMNSGGLFRGRSGVDTNLARLSDGEFIVNARSTQNYLPFLHAINNTPAYARGGYNGAMNNQLNNIMQPIVLETVIHGRNLRLIQKKDTSYRKKYSGAVNG